MRRFERAITKPTAFLGEFGISEFLACLVEMIRDGLNVKRNKGVTNFHQGEQKKTHFAFAAKDCITIPTAKAKVGVMYKGWCSQWTSVVILNTDKIKTGRERGREEERGREGGRGKQRGAFQ